MRLDIVAQKELINKINKESREYSYQPLDWDVLTIYNRFYSDKDEDKDEDDIVWNNENSNKDFDVEKDIYVPTYQRNLTWDNKKKSKFIESLFLNLPIPFIFLNKTIQESEEWFEVLQYEIIDWSQRIRTIFQFINNSFRVNALESLTELNSLKYKDLPVYLQRKFLSIPLRVVVFEWLDIEKRKEMFNRINTSWDSLTSMEVRKWTYEWNFYSLLYSLSKTRIFNDLLPLSSKKKNRDEWSELLLRFFAYIERFEQYDWKVESFLNTYMKDKSDYLSLEEIKKENSWIENDELNIIFESRKQELEKLFYDIMNFVKDHFPYWFKKSKDAKVAASRVYFESIAVWVWLALKEKSSEQLITTWIKELLNSKIYEDIIASDWANAKSKFENRINIIKEYLLTGNYDRFKDWSR